MHFKNQIQRNIASVQGNLHLLGFDPGPIDGIAGIRTMNALDLALETPEGMKTLGLPWGRKVSPAFRVALYALCYRQRITPAYLMACMAWESAETFSPSIRNAAGSGATGLIQFMPNTARALHTTTDKLAAMTAEEQLIYVEHYFKPYKNRLETLADHYMAILWPAAIGKPYHHPLWDKATRPTTYRQNSGIDINKDGLITKAEAAAKVTEKLFKGFGPEYLLVD